jgi:hypothetical protein
VKIVRRITGLQGGSASHDLLNWAVPQTSPNPERCVKTVLRITRTSRLLSAAVVAMVLAGCADQPTSPVRPNLGPAAVGSIIKSSVVTSTTLCRSSGECSTSTKYSEISEKVGSTSTLRAAMGISVGEEQQSKQTASPFKARAPKNVHVSGRTFYADADNDDGSTSHIELTGDAGAKGKLSGVRLFRDGKPLLAINVKWKDVGGVSYREHTDVTLYSGGRVAMHQERDFSPIALVAASGSDRSPATLTLSSTQVIYGDESDGCPFSTDICYWLRSYNPAGALNEVWSEMEGIAQSISNWFNGIWSGQDGNTTAELAETMMLASEAYNQPGLLVVATTLFAIADGGLTDSLLQAAAWAVEEEILDLLLAFGMI